MHAQTAGHDVVTFEMLHETFRDQVRSSTSAPVEVEGGGIGMVRCTRDVLKCVRIKLLPLSG
jgi:origin recognition complex subunit 4